MQCNPDVKSINGIEILIIYNCPSFIFQIWRLYQMAWKKWTQDGWIGKFLYHMIKKLSKWKLYWEIYISLSISKAKLFLEAMFFIIIFYLSDVNIQVQYSHGVLSRLVSCFKCMELACWVLQASTYLR